MRTSNLMSSLQALARSDKPLILADTSNNPVSKLQPGQRIQAVVQEQVSPGLFKVQVNGQFMQLRLPAQLQQGSTLDLQVESTIPRLTFSFSASAQPMSTPDQISATSRFLANIAELPLAKAHIESSSGPAVWQTGGATPDTRQLAAGLKDALANSGLFYESHQAQWVGGERSTAQLLIEPQNQLPRTTSTDTSLSLSALPVNKELIPLVQQQLHTLETHQLTWSGQIWPNQHMQWEIQGQPEGHAQHPDERLWSTEMELDLNKLGDVHARLVYNQGGIKLTLHAADAASVDLFNRHLPELHNTLTAAGIRLTSAVVEKA